MVRLNTVFPYIAGEISEEARLGSLAHWAYSNKSTAKVATNEQLRWETVNHLQDLTDQPRKQRVAHFDADYEEARSSHKTNTVKSRGNNAPADQSAAAKRRKVERPPAMDIGSPMERSARSTGVQRVLYKDAMEKKRSCTSNASTVAARKKYAF